MVSSSLPPSPSICWNSLSARVALCAPLSLSASSVSALKSPPIMYSPLVASSASVSFSHVGLTTVAVLCLTGM